MHVMLDIETWSTKPNATIISIGACVFDPHSTAMGSKFYVAIDPNQGRHIDPDTILWWMSPDRTEAREAWLQEAKLDLYSALDGLCQWAHSCAAESSASPDSFRVWGNGSDFDNVIVRNAMEFLGIEPFWRHWDNRCYRTTKNMAPNVKIERAGTYHNALSDAVDQAVHMQRVVAHAGLTVL